MARATVSERLAEALAPRCAACRGVLPPEREVTDVVSFGDLLFHFGCRPRCATCPTELLPGAAGWRGEGRVVAEPWGWAVRPERFWCPACLGSATLDEPRSNM